MKSLKIFILILFANTSYSQITEYGFFKYLGQSKTYLMNEFKVLYFEDNKKVITFKKESNPIQNDSYSYMIYLDDNERATDFTSLWNKSDFLHYNSDLKTLKNLNWIKIKESIDDDGFVHLTFNKDGKELYIVYASGWYAIGYKPK